MLRLYAIIAVLIATLGSGALWISYQAGWDAHQSVSDAKREATQRENEKVIQRASERLSYGLGKAEVQDLIGQDLVWSIENDESLLGNDLCSLPAGSDILRKLEAIR
jgi:hypothetical protein